MGKDLHYANERFRKLLGKLKSKKNESKLKEVEPLLYIFYLQGFNDGSGMTQVIA